MTGIYIITNLINGKRYIGQSINIKRRFWDHRCISHESNIHLKNALIKYGRENFKYEILEECDVSNLDEREIFYISKLKPEYNISSGGQRAVNKHSESTKKIISQKSKKQWENMSEETKQKIINNLTGPKEGHKVSEKTKEKLRMINLGKKQSPETISKRKETIIRMKENGYVQTNASHKKKVVCVETGQVFESVKSAAEFIGCHPSGVTSVLKKRQRTVKGYRFEYLEV